MSIVSTPFLFLFLPFVTGLYFLIPRKNGLTLRNIYIVLVSLFFYAWGEPAFVFLLLLMAFLTWLLGKRAEGAKGTARGKSAVALTVVMNLAAIVILGKFNALAELLSRLTGKELGLHLEALPLGFTFFVFFSISYVVDVYRGQIAGKNTLLNSLLYTCAFFKITQGPIVSYRKFQAQIDGRKESLALVGEGIWRFSVGFGKKMIIAANLSPIVNHILQFDFSAIAAPTAWLGCIGYLVYLYFDFSGYSDMAIGLGKIFGFSLPENFNYPYVSTSVAEFWRRFHITLCAWFTEYLYYPLVLGPSVRLRKILLRHNVPDKAAKTVQGIFVPACVWLVTALWHGINLNYAIWGIANCSAMLLEMHIKPLKNKRLNFAVRWVGFLLFLCLSMPLISIDTFSNALLYYKAMFVGGFQSIAICKYLLQACGWFLAVGVVGCFPVAPLVKKKITAASPKTYEILSAVVLLAVVLLAIAYLLKSGTSGFLYQQ